MPDNRPYRKWYMHRRDALRRGIPFLLSFERWMQIWLDSGHWHERGKKKGQYVMARPGDKGAYEEGNVKIILQEDNTREACVGKKASVETRAKMSASRTGYKHPEETIAKIRASNVKTYQNVELRKMVGASHSGWKQTQETRSKMSAGQKQRRAREALKELEALAYALV